jgi:integrase
LNPRHPDPQYENPLSVLFITYYSIILCKIYLQSLPATLAAIFFATFFAKWYIVPDSKMRTVSPLYSLGDNMAPGNGKIRKRESMSWVSKQHRWTKQYRGKTYSISCRQLQVEPTKEGSRVAANDWWASKQKEIDEQLGQAKKHPAHVVDHYEKAIEQHRLFAKWHRRYGDPIKAEKAEVMVEFLKETLTEDNPPYPLPPQQQKPIDMMYEVLGENDYEDPTVWYERFKQIKREEQADNAVPHENTIRAHIDDYLTLRKARVIAGKNTLGTYDTFKGRLMTFRAWVDPFAPVENLNEALWERYYTYLASQCEQGKLAITTASGTLNTARDFIKSRWERHLIDLPRNLNSRGLTISQSAKEIVPLTKEEVKTLLDNCANEKDRLYILLMLNCGMYPVDIAKLTKEEYKNGHIIRKRSKTRNRSVKVPKVDYPLWRETNRLLKKYQSDHPELVLVNRTGSPLWKEIEKDGKIFRISNITCVINRLRERVKIKKSLKSIRKTSASMLDNHPEYGRYAEYFLGEAPHSVASKHYVKPSQEQFDKAIKWLGEQFGF